MKKIFFTLFFTALFLMTVNMAEAKVAGKFTVIKGRVDVLKTDVVRGEKVRQGDMVFEGDIIRTKSDGYAEIKLIDGSTLKLAPKGRLQISKMLLKKDGSRESSIINLFKGKLRSIVSKSKKKWKLASWFDADFKVNTATAVVGVKGTDFVTVYIPEMGFTVVTVEEGGVVTGFNGVANPNFSYANMMGGGDFKGTIGQFMEVSAGQVVSIHSDGKMDLGGFVPPSFTNFSYGGGSFDDGGTGDDDDFDDGGGGEGEPLVITELEPEIPVTETFADLFNTLETSFVATNYLGAGELTLYTDFLAVFELVDGSIADFALSGDYTYQVGSLTFPDDFNGTFTGTVSDGVVVDGGLWGTWNGDGTWTASIDFNDPNWAEYYVPGDLTGTYSIDSANSTGTTEVGVFTGTGTGTVYDCSAVGCAF